MAISYGDSLLSQLRPFGKQSDQILLFPNNCSYCGQVLVTDRSLRELYCFNPTCQGVLASRLSKSSNAPFEVCYKVIREFKCYNFIDLLSLDRYEVATFLAENDFGQHETEFFAPIDTVNTRNMVDAEDVLLALQLPVISYGTSFENPSPFVSLIQQAGGIKPFLSSIENTDNVESYKDLFEGIPFQQIPRILEAFGRFKSELLHLDSLLPGAEPDEERDEEADNEEVSSETVDYNDINDQPDFGDDDDDDEWEVVG